MFKTWALTIAFLLIVLLSGCEPPAASCPPPSQVDLSAAAAFFGDDQYPFQFPLEDRRVLLSADPFSTGFASYGMTTRGPEYHAAEDILQPAGAPVFAMADGIVSFSGPMGGYGWLVIIDHPQANIYSLYGHLSPSRWEIERGPVEKGALIGYLGDPDENGGSAERPLRPHLHFGVRTGQRTDYPGMEQWRWMAGWIKPCPQDLGWLQPSLIITRQEIPAGGFKVPAAGFLARWWMELLFAGIYLTSGVCVLIFATRRGKTFLLILSGIALFTAGWVFSIKDPKLSAVIFAMALILTAVGSYRLIRPHILPSENS